MKTIELTNCDKLALVDDKDYERLIRYKWHIGTNGYVLRSSGGDKIYMHRDVTNCPPDRQVDHLDANRLNNQSYNLRVVSSSENAQARKLQENNTSGYRGVIWQEPSWRAQIYVNKRRISLGCFATKERAARAYNEAAVKYFGANAKLNGI